MFKTRFILVLGVLALFLVTLAISRPFVSAPTLEELSWPPRPVIIPVTDTNDLSDYYERHPEWVSSGQDAVIPVTGASESSDYYQRHPELRASVEVSADISDYFMRHPELRAPGLSEDLTDYFLRHPELNAP